MLFYFIPLKKLTKKRSNMTAAKECLATFLTQSKIQRFKQEINWTKSKHQLVTFNGWIEGIRKLSKNLTFLMMRSGTTRIQCISEIEIDANVEKESFVTVSGYLKELEPDKHAPNGIEFYVSKLTTNSESKRSAILNNTTTEFPKYIAMRSEKNLHKLCKMRRVILRSFEDVLESQNFTDVGSKQLTETIFEGEKGDALAISASGRCSKSNNSGKVFLTQSNQLYLETFLPAVGNVYSIGKCFRNEINEDETHLKEFTQIECEMICNNFKDLLQSFEFLLKSTMESVLKTLTASDRDSLGKRIETFCEDYQMLSFDNAITILQGIKESEDDFNTLYPVFI